MRLRGKAFSERMWRARVLRQVERLETLMSEAPPGATLGARERGAFDALETAMREAPIGGVRFTTPKPPKPARMRISDDIPKMARRYGVDAAIAISRELGVHPDHWAREVADEFDDYSVHELYQESLSPLGRASKAA